MTWSIPAILRRSFGRLYSWPRDHSPRTNRRPLRARPSLECLEDRVVPAGEAVLGESVFSLNQFEQNVRSFFEDNSVGFAYSMNYNGMIGARHDGWGDARTEADGQKDFTEDSRMTIASVAKAITATAILKIFQDQQLSVDTAIASYLPADWTLGPSINTITFRELLTHLSGLRRIDFNGSGSDSNGPDWNGDGFDDDGASLNEQTSYGGLKQLIALGITNTSDADGNGQIDLKETFSYENANFALMRVMLPYLLSPTIGAWIDQLDNDNDKAEVTAAWYTWYVRSQVLSPMGIEDAQTHNLNEEPEDRTLTYPFPYNGSTPGFDWRDRTLVSGGEGWFLSADELATFLHHVRYENTVLSAATRQLMADGFLGWNGPEDWSWADGMFGTYYNHGGDLSNLHTHIMSFPNTAQVALLINSNYGNGLAHQGTLMKQAFENAWPELVIAGTSGDDAFELRRNPGDSSSLDIYLNGNLIGTRWISTLDRLTLRGLGGADTFEIYNLPQSVELVVRGGGGPDTLDLRFGLDAQFIRGDITFYGGNGSDTLLYNDPTNVGDDTYAIGYMTIDKTNHPTDVTYQDVETIALTTGWGHERVHVNATPLGTDVHVFAGSGDVVRVGNGDIDSNIHGDVSVTGSDGPVRLVLDDEEDSFGDDTHTLYNGTYTKTDYAGTIFYTSVQELVLNTGEHNDTVNVNLQEFGLEATINTHQGQDTVRVHAVAASSTVNVNTGAHSDTVRITPDSRILNFIQGTVVANAGAGPNDRLSIHDHDSLGEYTYNLRQAAFDRTGIGSVEFEDFSRVELYAGDHDSRINIRRILPGVHLTVRGRGGDDEIVAGHVTGDLDSFLLGDLSVYGGEGEDTLRFTDVHDEGNDSYAFGWQSFTKPGLHSWFYDEVEELELHANDDHNLIDVGGQLSTNLTVHARGGNDTINIGTVGAIDLAIEAGSGNDTINLGAGRIDFMRADVFVNGGLGADTININDQDAPGGYTYTFAGQTFDASGPFFGSLSYLSIGDVVLSAGDGGDTINVESLSLSTDLALFAGGGDDTVNIGSGTLNALLGEVTADGGTGADTLNVLDHIQGGDLTYTVTSSTVSRDSFLDDHGILLNYSGMEGLNLATGPGDSTINVENTLAATSLTIDAGPGDDTIHLAPTGQDLSMVAGAVTVHGADDSDAVILHDEMFPGGAFHPYTLDHDSLSRSFFGGLTFDTIEHLVLEMGFGDDTVNVMGFHPDTVFYLNGHAGNDTFNVTVRPSVLNTGGSIVIDGGSPTGLLRGSDQLNVSYVPDPAVTHEIDPDDPHAGRIRLDYLDALFAIAYASIEQVKIAPL